MRAFVEKVWAVMSDCRFREVQLFTAPKDGRALYLLEQIISAPPAAATEQKATSYGCDIFLGFRGGLLSDYIAQYEITEMMRQFGMLPTQDGRVGGAYLLSLMGSRSENR